MASARQGKSRKEVRGESLEPERKLIVQSTGEQSLTQEALWDSLPNQEAFKQNRGNQLPSSDRDDGTICWATALYENQSAAANVEIPSIDRQRLW